MGVIDVPICPVVMVLGLYDKLIGFDIVGLPITVEPKPPNVRDPAAIKVPPTVIADVAAMGSILSLYVPFVNCVCFTTVIELLVVEPIVNVPLDPVNKLQLPPIVPTACVPVKILTCPAVCPDV